MRRVTLGQGRLGGPLLHGQRADTLQSELAPHPLGRHLLVKGAHAVRLDAQSAEHQRGGDAGDEGEGGEALRKAHQPTR